MVEEEKRYFVNIFNLRGNWKNTEALTNINV
jgi:hypothetical protein